MGEGVSQVAYVEAEVLGLESKAYDLLACVKALEGDVYRKAQEAVERRSIDLSKVGVEPECVLRERLAGVAITLDEVRTRLGEIHTTVAEQLGSLRLAVD